MSRAVLAQLRELRATGKTRLSTYKVEEEENIYDEVDEEGYKKVVRGRLDQDDFVIDDNGEGYADDGREEWNTEHRRDTPSDGEDCVPLKGKAGTFRHPHPRIQLLIVRRSQEKTRRRQGAGREDESQHQQVFQQQTRCCGVKAQGTALPDLLENH